MEEWNGCTGEGRAAHLVLVEARADNNPKERMDDLFI
jgi:hypothetical protein